VSEAASLADQYVAVRKAERPAFKGHDFASKCHATKPKSFGESGRSNTTAGFQKTSFGHNAKPYDEQQPSATSTRSLQILPFGWWQGTWIMFIL